MRFVRFNTNRIGVLRPAGIIDVTERFDLRALWPSGPGDLAIAQLGRVQSELLSDRVENWGSLVDTASARLDCPVANPGKIIGAPVNYKAHIDEANADAQINEGRTYTTLEAYGLFIKANSSLAGPADDLRLTFPDRRTDHEVELALVIGKTGHDIDQAEALDYVAGYTVGLDMSLRGKEVPSYRKSPDGYAIVGPSLVTPDEVPNPNDLALLLTVNGEPRQHSSTSHLILSIENVIAYASRIYTLHPGDIIMTGTPEGVGQVQPGDLIEASVAGVGSLSIRVKS